MSNKLFDFLSSFGLMILGVSLLFIFTLSFAKIEPECKYSFPKSNLRVNTIGGDVINNNFPMSSPTVPLAKDIEKYEAEMTAQVAFVIDKKTDTVLYEKNPDKIWPIASISKLVSALVLLDLPMKWTATTTIQEEDYDSSSHYIKAGEIFSLNDLWSMALIGSSNNAIRSLVRASGLSSQQFVKLMNDKVEEMDLLSMHFEDPTGLDSRNVGNAKDLAQLLKEAIKNNKITKTLKIGEYYAHPLANNKPRRIWSTNWLLTKWIENDFDKNSTYGKTGFIYDSLYNFVVNLEDDSSHEIIVVILGAEINEARFTESRDLANWIFNHYTWPDQEGYDELSD